MPNRRPSLLFVFTWERVELVVTTSGWSNMMWLNKPDGGFVQVVWSSPNAELTGWRAVWTWPIISACVLNDIWDDVILKKRPLFLHNHLVIRSYLISHYWSRMEKSTILSMSLCPRAAICVHYNMMSLWLPLNAISGDTSATFGCVSIATRNLLRYCMICSNTFWLEYRG